MLRTRGLVKEFSGFTAVNAVDLEITAGTVHALEGLSKVVALEGAEHGVTSNCVNPAYVRTPLVENQVADQAAAHGMPPEQVVQEVMLARAAIRRLIEPEEVAELVAYLCSPAAAMITGASQTIDGGWTAH